jgi:DNA (cytosine-5)-methyltransferase 1
MDMLCAGFPCQDISTAGSGAGINGPKSGLFSEVVRAIDAIQPGVIMLENSPAIRTRGREVVIEALVSRGYAWRDGTLGAVNLGAPHNRQRWWCLAVNANGQRKLQQEWSLLQGWISRRAETNTNPLGDRPQEEPKQQKTQLARMLLESKTNNSLECKDLAAIASVADFTGCFGWPYFDTCFRRVAHGVSNRVDSIKGLGNAQVPLTAAAAYLHLAHAPG